jgi:hypothetical protein
MSGKGKWTLKYGFAAVLLAIAIIAVSLLANPVMLPQPKQTYAGTSFAVMLTDPPTVPAGTTVLNLTYSNFLLHVTYPNGTVEWLPVNASGTVNLFSLVNMTQTLASVVIPVNSTVDMIQFTIADVEAVVNGATYNVTALSSTLVIKVDNGLVNETLSGVLLDFNPTLVQIQATDANGTLVNYYVLVPSATAVVVNNLSKDELKVGTIVKIGENNHVKLVHVEEEFQENLTITSASLSVNGNVTTLSVTLKNEGSIAFRVFGLTLHGDFNETHTWKAKMGGIGGMGGMGETSGMNGKGKHGMNGETSMQVANEQTGVQGANEVTVEGVHPLTIPFKVNGSSLVPLLGNDGDGGEEHGNMNLSSLVLQPNETVVLGFTGVIAIQPGKNDNGQSGMVFTPIVGENYTLRLTGEGFQTYNVTATA